MPGGARSDARWIFHIGHVGSTLVARLLGELDGSAGGARAAHPARSCAALDPARARDFVPAIRKLFSRTLRRRPGGAGQGDQLRQRDRRASWCRPGGRALFLTATPRNYIASILAGDNRVQRTARAGPRAAPQRMAGRVDGLGRRANHAELAAAAWACEMTALEAAAEALPNAHILWIDFDRCSTMSATACGAIAACLGLDAPAEAACSARRQPAARALFQGAGI